MSWPDIVNGLFETVGSVMTWRNFLQLRRDREVKGVYWPMYWFYTAWGFWNLAYYSVLDQWFSWTAGVVLTVGNLCWAVTAWRLSK